MRISDWSSDVCSSDLAAKRWPQQVRAFLLNAVKRRLPEGYDMSHFTPRYMPWDERLCAVPDADLFKAISDGKASVVTDHKIGRASCRERGCQYVYISVVSVYLKKKKTKNKNTI